MGVMFDCDHWTIFVSFFSLKFYFCVECNQSINVSGIWHLGNAAHGFECVCYFFFGCFSTIFSMTVYKNSAVHVHW